MPATVEQALNALAAQITIQNTEADGANRFSLSAPVGERDGLAVDEIAERLTTTIENAPVDLNLRAKYVRFDIADPANTTITGGMPVSDPAPVGSTPLSELVEGGFSPADPGVPGIAGGLTGAIPIPIQSTDLQSINHAVSVTARWAVVDESGEPVAEVTWTFDGQTGQGGVVPATTNGLADTLQITIASGFTELTSPEIFIRQNYVTASIRLIAGGVATEWIDLPPFPLRPAIPIPTIAVLSTVTNNRGRHHLVLVPATSPIDNIQRAADLLREVRDLADVPWGLELVLDNFVPAAGKILDLLSQNDLNIRFRRTDAIARLNSIKFIDRGFLRNDFTANDEFSSAVMVGPPGRALRCYNAYDYSDSEGVLELRSGAGMGVIVENLHSNTPVSIPEDSAVVVLGEGNSFGNRFSSLEFGSETPPPE